MDANLNEPYRLPAPSTRHDGWTGEAMAKFLETLADTGIVLDACEAAGKSSTASYALRRREPLFAEAWQTALGMARDRLADTLLARSIEGNVEQIIKDGVVVAEKHYIDNRLGQAMLKRLDQRLDEARAKSGSLSPSQGVGEPDWDVALTALRTGDGEDIAKALAMLKQPEVCEVCDPPIEEVEGDTFDHPRIWRDFGTDEWRTNYPPPPGFTGFEQGDWDDETYLRALSDEELAALVAAGIAEPSEVPHDLTIEQDEAERRAFFDSLAGREQEQGDAAADPA